MTVAIIMSHQRYDVAEVVRSPGLIHIDSAGEPAVVGLWPTARGVAQRCSRRAWSLSCRDNRTVPGFRPEYCRASFSGEAKIPS